MLYRGGAEQKIRSYLIRNNFVDTVIQLPDNLFFGVSIATCIIVLKKSKIDANILFIDASKEFVHEGNKNKLSDDNIRHIYDAWHRREDVAHFARLVSNDDILANDANISVSSYVEPEDTTEKVDINELNKRIADIVAKENALRTEIDKIVAELAEVG